MRRVLIIGGNRFVGRQLVWRLIAAGEQVTTLNRGSLPDSFGNRIERLRADRTTSEFADVLRGRDFDAVVDFAAFTAADTQGAVEVLQDRVGHYVFISSGAVYMAREGAQLPCTAPLTEAAYTGNVAPKPNEPEDVPSWRYGTGKRAAEDVLIAAWAERKFPSTRLRLPTVNGVGDPERRIESYLYRILDGGPVLLPDGGAHLTKHVYSGDVVKGIVSLLGNSRTYGEAFNFSQEEQPTLRELIQMLADILGAPNRSQGVDQFALESAGLSARMISPFSGRWASCLDSARAKEELGFRHTPLSQYLETIVAAFLSHMPAEPPEDYANRAQEIKLGRSL